MLEWEVMPTEPKQRSWPPRSNGFGFTVHRINRAEAFTFVYDTQADEEKAEAAVREAVTAAADIFIG